MRGRGGITEALHRRSVVEGIFSAFKERFGRSVLSKIRQNQDVEVLCRVVAWNVLALAYHSYRRKRMGGMEGRRPTEAPVPYVTR